MVLRRHPLDLLRRKPARPSGPGASSTSAAMARSNGLCRSRARPPERSKAASGTRSAFGKHSGASGPGSRTPKPPLISASPGRHRRQLRCGMADLRQRDLLPAPSSAVHERARIDLAADRPIAADGGRIPRVRAGPARARRWRATPAARSPGRARRGARTPPAEARPWSRPGSVNGHEESAEPRKPLEDRSREPTT